MAKVRLEITKGDEIRYLSHLDYARAIERALRRSKLPVVYSEGFNPHMKVAYASALSVGVASSAEYMDMELKDDLAPEAIRQRLTEQLPPGIVLKSLKYVSDRTPALMAIINQAVYEVTLPLTGSGADAIKCLDLFHETLEVLYTKESPKGKRIIDIKQFIAAPIRATVSDSVLKVELVIHITPTGSVKAAEVLAILASRFGLPVHEHSAIITRTGLYIASEGSRLTPMEII